MTTITTLPVAPSRADPSTFSTRADALLGALAGFVSETNLVAGEVNATATASSNSSTSSANSATASANSATASANSASSSAATSNVTQWVSGTTYTLGANVFSPLNSLTYRRRVTGAGTIDPSNDAANWAVLLIDRLPISIVIGTTQTAVPNVFYQMTNAAAGNLLLPAATGSGNVIGVMFTNTVTNNVVSRVSGTIMGSATDMTADVNTGLPIFFRDINSDWRLYSGRAGTVLPIGAQISDITGGTLPASFTTLNLGAYTVATLPAGVVGMIAYVTDASAPTYNATLVGGGAVRTLAFFNGSAWTAH